MRRIGLCLGLALLAACAAPPAPPPPPPDPAAACLFALDQRQVLYDRVKDWTTPEGCGITGAIRLKRASLPLNRDTLMACPLALTLWDFETTVVQPAARKYLKQSANKLFHAGTYDCRGERGGRPERLSQHSFGKAIDITGFSFDDGTVASVLHDWHGKSAKAQFLHEVAQGACGIFNVVITPNHNIEHRDHIHVDIGPYKMCGN